MAERLKYVKTQSNSWKRTQAKHSLTSANVFSGQSLKETEINAKINQCNLTKQTSFCTAKETKIKTKRQFTEWDKIFSNDATDKGLIFKIYKQLKQVNSKKSQETNGKMGKRLEVTFHKKYTDGQQAQKHAQYQ